MSNNRYTIGLLIVSAGVILILGKLGVFSFLGNMLWPIFVLLPGLVLHYLFFNRIWPSGVLIPGAMLVTYALIFFYCNVFGWQSMSYLWPGFILGLAIGLYEFYLFDRNRPRIAITASIVLALIACIFFSITILSQIGIYAIALAFIVIGIAMLISRSRSY